MKGSGIAVRDAVRAGTRSDRVGLVFVVALSLLLTSVAVAYAVGDDAEPPIPAEAVAPVVGGPPHGPDNEAMLEALRLAEQEEAKREEELASPAAEKEREDSRRAYAGLSPAQAEELLAVKFPEFLASLNADPARTLSDSHLEHNLGEGDAVVTTDGDTQLLEGSYPVETQNDEGELEKVDVSLQETTDGYEAENPLVELAIADSAADGIVLGGEGSAADLPPIAVAQVGAEGSAARLFGDKNVFFGEVEPGSDTDLLVSPTALGVEVANLLRTADSPETLRFHVDLPAVAELRAEPSGGAEVITADGSILYRVGRPVAFDAQGSQVPTTLEIEGDNLVLEVPHREADVAYPILVDPQLEMNWNQGNLPGIAPNGPWIPYVSAANNGISYGTSDTFWPNTPGLYFAAQEGYLGANIWTQLAYFPPNENSYIAKAVINTFPRKDACALVKDPYDYTGMWTWNNGGTAETPHWNGYRTNDAYNYGNSTINAWGNEFVIGYGNASARINPCWRNVRVGGTQIWLEDWQYPYLNSVGATPEGWTKKDGTARTFNVSATDAGLGVKTVRMFGVGTQVWDWKKVCTGTWESPCPTSGSGQITFTTSGFPYEGRYNSEGKERKFTVQALDPTDKSWQIERPLWLDGVAPLVSLKGQLAVATDQVGSTEKAQETTAKDDELSLPTYKLEVEADDGADRSGVQEIKVYLDKDPGKEPGATPVATKSAGSCPTAGCGRTLSMEYTLRLPGLEAGKHSLWVVAVDKVGNSTPLDRNIEFEYIPATGMKEEYVLQHFRLPDGNDYSGEAEYHGPEIAVNVMNGNVVFHERDVNVEADRSEVDLERVYNSQQPSQKDTQWGRGFSIAQTPELEPQPGPTPQKATMTQTGKITSAVTIPQILSQSTFSSKLRALITKIAGGYEIEPATSDEATVFSDAGRVEEVVLGDDTPVEFELEEAPLFASSLGSSGSGNGQLNQPADAAVDAKGNVWVVDRINNRLVEFDEAGDFVRTAGSTGSGAGQLSSPSAIAIDSLGNINVTDTANNRIVRFDGNGVFTSVLGWNVNKTKVEGGGTQLEKNRCAASSGHACQAGSAGSGEGQISEPIGITTTGGQNFFVVERASNRVEKFNPQGEVLAKFGSAGSEAGQLKEPTAIAHSPIGGGYLWVADTGNNRIEAWTTSYAYSRQYGKEGSGQVEFKKPVAIEADVEGNVYVGDVGNQRVQEITRGGDFITQFGGTGALEFANPSGIFLDAGGSLWVTDSGGDRLQQWVSRGFLFNGSRIGSYGTGNGQFNHPADIALDGKGNIWALDKANHRLEKFNEKGEFVQAVGSKGGAAGQLNAPAALAIDPSGNLWVADSANNRIEEFNEKGEFVLTFGRDVNKTKVDAAASEAERNVCTAASGNICQAGVVGSTNGQLKAPQGIAATSGGNLWISDTGNNRLKKFGPTGNLINILSSEGSEGGKVKEPTAIAMAPDGSIWVADSGNNRIQGWNSSLVLIRQFGSEGTADGQFKRPAALDVDTAGNFWVGDQNNSRIQQFNSGGEFVSKFGNAETFRFSSPMGLVTDGKGSLWLTDTDHNRLQRRVAPISAGVPGDGGVGTAPYFDPPAVDYEYSEGKLTSLQIEDEATQGEDPSLDMSLSSGVVTEVASDEMGDTDYGYEAGKLKSIAGIDGETKYGYDASGRMNSVTLPNGTIATITYDSTSRATSVKVDPAGPETAKTTNFAYSAEPRRTTVWGGGAAETFYDIGDDGSVVKWAWAETPPTIASISGSLWSQKGQLLENKDQTLFATGSSPHHIASIKVVVNGNSVVEEKTCTDPSSPPTQLCDQPAPLEWITHPSEHAAGRMDIEVVVEDFDGRQTAERFFVVVPQQPPPGPETVERPNFHAIKVFREDYGLDLNNPRTEPQMNELLLELLYEWEKQDPTAMTAVEKWGIPMRASELDEMEWRKTYIGQAAEVIPQWAEEHASSTYGGFYVDQRAGGKIYVGFTGSTQQQMATVEALKQSGALLNSAQVYPYPVPPERSVTNLESLQSSISAAIQGNTSVREATVSLSLASGGSNIQVGATNPDLVEGFVKQQFGQSVSAVVSYEERPIRSTSRYESSGPIYGGAAIVQNGAGKQCTAGFGTRAPTGQQQGQTTYSYFAITAGHCFGKGATVARQPNKQFLEGPEIGKVRRQAFGPEYSGDLIRVDAEAILIDKSLRSHSVLNGSPMHAESIQGAQHPRVGRFVCWSGVTGGQHCGEVLRRDEIYEGGMVDFVFRVEGPSAQGDSGGPVWDPITHKAVGLIAALPLTNKCWTLPKQFSPIMCPRMVFTPLLPRPNQSFPEGALPKLGVDILKEE
jgi:tripartite motif-containing protein 71